MRKYLQDFQHVGCMGAGGFGVVFEAVHQIDGIHYAIKRIRVRAPHHLPHKPLGPSLGVGADPDEAALLEQNKDRLLREVKAVARLYHPNIIRYNQAWFETPPAQWQDLTDAKLLSKYLLFHSFSFFTFLFSIYPS